MKRARGISVMTAAVLATALPASAGAATQVGSNFASNDSNCGDVTTTLQTASPNNSYAAPADGVITSWTFQSDVYNSTTAPVSLVVARPVGASDYLTVGRSSPHVPVANVSNTYADVRIPARAGDVLGLFTIDAETPNVRCARMGQAGFENRFYAGMAQPGSTHSYVAPSLGRQLNLSAVLEPDCDNDGFGDETQDSDLTLCDRVAPDTTITKAPRDKTKKKTATFEFTGIDARAVAGFECSLDGGSFAACASPHTITVKKGKHTFSVRATDHAGNGDASPATDDWKVKKKRKK